MSFFTDSYLLVVIGLAIATLGSLPVAWYGLKLCLVLHVCQTLPYTHWKEVTKAAMKGVKKYQYISGASLCIGIILNVISLVLTIYENYNS